MITMVTRPVAMETPAHARACSVYQALSPEGPGNEASILYYVPTPCDFVLLWQNKLGKPLFYHNFRAPVQKLMRENLILLSLFQSDVHDFHIIIRFICFWMSLCFTDELTDIHAFHNTTKYCVLVIKPWLERERDRESGREREGERGGVREHCRCCISYFKAHR